MRDELFAMLVEVLGSEEAAGPVWKEIVQRQKAAFRKGMKQALWQYAVWHDGVEHVGSGTMTLVQAQAEVDAGKYDLDA